MEIMTENVTALIKRHKEANEEMSNLLDTCIRMLGRQWKVFSKSNCRLVIGMVDNSGRCLYGHCFDVYYREAIDGFQEEELMVNTGAKSYFTPAIDTTLVKFYAGFFRFIACSELQERIKAAFRKLAAIGHGMSELADKCK